jgi:hypothetical protein
MLSQTKMAVPLFTLSPARWFYLYDGITSEGGSMNRMEVCFLQINFAGEYLLHTVSSSGM